MKKSTSRKKRNLLQNILYGIYLVISWIVNRIKNVKFSKIVVISLLVLTIMFIVKMIGLFETYGSTPDTLITAVLPAVLGQLWVLSKITRNKDTLQSNERMNEYEEYRNDDDYLGG